MPVIGCDCEVCQSEDVRDNRLRSSILVEYGKTRVIIDTGPDFRQQMLRERVRHLDAVVFTHSHKDHIAGLDDVRAFNFKQGHAMDVYAAQEVQEALHREFHYIFANDPYPGIPKVHLTEINRNAKFEIGEKKWIPVEVLHYKMPVLGFRVDNFAYVTDAKTINKSERDKLRNCNVLVLNALRIEPHISHLSLKEAIEVARELNAKKTYFTHISHMMGTHQQASELLPENMHLAYDGLRVLLP